MQVHFINLERAAERRDNFLRTNHGIAEFHRFDAVDGSRFTEEDLIAEGIVAEHLELFTPRSFGSTLSHLSLWDQCITSGEPFTIAEDDAVFNRHFARKAEALLAGLPDDWDVVRWSWNADSVLHVNLIAGLTESISYFQPDPLRARLAEFQQADFAVVALRLIQAFGIACYTVSPKGAKLLTESCFPLRNELIFVRGLRKTIRTTCLDSTMNNYYRDVNAHVCFPPLVWSDNVKNDS